MGAKNVLEFIGGFNEADSVTGIDTFKNLLAWFALEEAAQVIVREQEEEEDDDD